MENVRCLDLATSTQERREAEGYIAAGAAVGFIIEGTGGCMEAGVEAEVTPERAGNAAMGTMGRRLRGIGCRGSTSRKLGHGWGLRGSKDEGGMNRR